MCVLCTHVLRQDDILDVPLLFFPFLVNIIQAQYSILYMNQLH